jgi:hypothetical protein
MNSPPLVLGLILCEKAIVEEDTRNVTLVSTFTRLVVEEFPSLPPRFAFYTVLSEGEGSGILDLVIVHLESNEEIHAARMPVHFADRVAELRVLFRIHRCSFPAPGEYLCTLMLDGEWLAQRRLQVSQKE